MPDPDPRIEAAAKALYEHEHLPNDSGDAWTWPWLVQWHPDDVQWWLDFATAALAAADAVDEAQRRAVAQEAINRTLRTFDPAPDDREALVQIVRNEVASYGAVTDPARGVPESLSAVDSDMPERIVDLILSRRSLPTVSTEALAQVLTRHQEEANDEGLIKCQCADTSWFDTPGEMAAHQARFVASALGIDVDGAL